MRSRLTVPIRFLLIFAIVCSFVCTVIGPAVQADDRRGGEVGLIVGAFVPDESLTLDPDTSVEASFGLRGGSVFSKHYGWFADILVTDVDTLGGFGTAKSYIGHSGFDVLFAPEKNARWFISAGAGWMTVDFDDSAVEDFHRPLAFAGFGQRIRVSTNTTFRWEVRADTTLDDPGLNGENVTQGHLLLGINWGPGTGGGGATGSARRQHGGPGDGDGDGIPDRRDDCPDTPAGARVDGIGCPVDTDQDGVADGIDRCSGTPADEIVGPDGCPSDNDGDGVRDTTDVCMNTPAGAVVDEWGCSRDNDADGVPNGIDLCPTTLRGVWVGDDGCGRDSDDDGVLDGLDRCADTPAGTPVDVRGCPQDRDGDGVADSLDRCAGTPRGTRVGTDGCPEAVPLFEEGRETLILDGVNFETNSAVLTSDSTVVLDRGARSLADWPEVRVEISGHTDSDGSAAYNLELSTLRASSVRTYLVSRGVSTGQLEVRGFGETRPIAPNTTGEEKARNRRVELRRLN